MMLHEFTYIDKKALPISEIMSNLKAHMEVEAENQIWAPSWRLMPVGTFKVLPDGSRQYKFKILGEWLK
jgi:hypothetical protein